jgi:phage shock protein PspC (stress-responsive transcriptional regulator)
MIDQTASPVVPPRRLTRSREDRLLSGVCGGVAEYAGIDANLVRLLVVLGTVAGFGSLLVAYLVAWALMPQPPLAAATGGSMDQPAGAPASLSAERPAG